MSRITGVITAVGRRSRKHSSPDGWSRLSRTALPAIGPRCLRARSSSYELPYRFDVLGKRDQGYTVRVVRRDDGWKVLRSRW